VKEVRAKMAEMVAMVNCIVIVGSCYKCKLYECQETEFM
jgi:hypothetical protein